MPATISPHPKTTPITNKVTLEMKDFYFYVIISSKATAAQKAR